MSNWTRPLIEGCNASGVCNLTLGEESPTFIYTPTRDGSPFSGWNASYANDPVYEPFDQDNDVGTPYRITRFNGSTVGLDFTGTAVYLCLAMSFGVTYTLTVDGQPYNTIAPPTDPACSGGDGVQTVAYADGLLSKLHSANLTVNLPETSSALSFYGGVVTLDVAAAGANISDPLYIDDTNPGWIYGNRVGDPYAWDHTGDTTNYNLTHSFTCTWDPASNATYTVESGAEALLLIGTPDANTYTYTVSLDGTNYVYNASNLFAHDGTVLFFANGLDPTRSHTITATNYNPNDPLGQGPDVQQCLSIDALVILSNTAPAPLPMTSAIPVSSPSSSTSPVSSLSSTQSSGSISRAAIAGIVVGILAGVIIGVSLWFFRRRFKVHKMRSPNEARFKVSPHARSVRQRSKRALNGLQTASDLPIIEVTRPTVAPAVEQASTLDLVQVLNQRLRNEQVDNIVEPPVYETV